jgi:hypothetical protein
MADSPRATASDLVRHHEDLRLLAQRRFRLIASKVLGWSRRSKLAHTFLWEHSRRRLKLAQLLGQLGVSLTCWIKPGSKPSSRSTQSPSAIGRRVI